MTGQLKDSGARYLLTVPAFLDKASEAAAACAIDEIFVIGEADGATIVSMPRFDLEEFLGTIEKHKVSIAPLVPPIVLALAKHPVVEKFDLSSIRLVFSGTARSVPASPTKRQPSSTARWRKAMA